MSLLALKIDFFSKQLAHLRTSHRSMRWRHKRCQPAPSSNACCACGFRQRTMLRSMKIALNSYGYTTVTLQSWMI
jgi:hypothetical protein